MLLLKGEHLYLSLGLGLLRGRGGLGFYLLASELGLLTRVLLLQGLLLDLLGIGVVRGVLGLDDGVLRLDGRELRLYRIRLHRPFEVDQRRGRSTITSR